MSSSVEKQSKIVEPPMAAAFPDWLKSVLECPGCRGMIVEIPVFSCDGSSGGSHQHPLCSGCHGSLRSEKKGCPVCGESVSGTTRNTVVEAIVEKLPKVHCQWGCGKKTPSKAMLKRHEDEECSHRLVPCGLCDNAKMNLLDLPNHLTNFHSATKIVIPLFKTFNLLSMSYAYLKVNRRSQKVCEVEGTTFLINWTLEADDSTVATTRNRSTPAAIFWACLVGPKSESDDFKYSLQILSSRHLREDKSVILYEGTRPCAPCDLGFAEVRQRKCGLVLDADLIIQASEGNGDKLQFNFSVQNIKQISATSSFVMESTIKFSNYAHVNVSD